MIGQRPEQIILILIYCNIQVRWSQLKPFYWPQTEVWSLEGLYIIRGVGTLSYWVEVESRK